MAVIRVIEEWQGRSGKWELKVSQLLGQNGRDYTRTFRVDTNSYTDDQGVILAYFAANGMPLGAAYPTDPWALLNCLEAKGAEDSLKWRVTANYTNLIDPSWFVDNPILKPTIWKLSFRKEKQSLVQVWKDALDSNGNLQVTEVNALNSAGLPFDPPLERERNIIQIHATINLPVASVNFFTVADYAGTVNLDTYRGCPPGTLRIAGLDVSEQLYQNSYAYYQVNWTLEFWDMLAGVGGLPGGWRAEQVLDASLYERVWVGPVGIDDRIQDLPDEIQNEPEDTILAAFPGSQQITRPIYYNGQPVSKPVPLDGKGRRLAPEDEPVYLTFNKYGDKLRAFTGVLP